MVEVQDSHRSVPGGDLRYVEVGTSFILRYLADRYFCYSLGFRNPQAGIDMQSVVAVMEAGRDRLAQSA
jgi:hypothetical protein